MIIDIQDISFLGLNFKELYFNNVLLILFHLF